MKRLISLLAISCLVTSGAIAQTDPFVKKLQHASKLYDGGKHDKAEEYLEDFLREHPDYPKGWDLLVAMRQNDYQLSKSLPNVLANSKVTVSSKDGKKDEPGVDSLLTSIQEMLSSWSPEKQARSKYLYTIRKALLHSNEAAGASSLYRLEEIDPNVDSNLNRKALRYYEDGEKQFAARNYQAAAKNYQRALDTQPGFYKAKMYLGDAFYASENYAQAAEAFKECVERYPDLLEPRKYLTDAYAKLELYDKAMAAAVDAMCVYPDCSMNIKLDDLAFQLNKSLDIKWTPRLVLPNRPLPASDKKDINAFQPKEDGKSPAGPWAEYVAAANALVGDYDHNGIRKPEAEPAGEQYLDVQSWHEMLSKSQDPALAEARRMEKAGFLDCYVLVTCFHPDVYSQYRHFAANNSDKIRRYYQKFLKDRS